MIHDPLDDAINTQFELSYELLYFLNWILEQDYEHEVLKKIIKRALAADLKGVSGRSLHKNNSKDAQALQHGLIEFFALLDALLYEAIHENTLEKIAQKNLTETIQQIDGTLCDNNTLHDSITKTTETMEISPEKNAKTVLFETLLKEWRPAKENEFH